jgi:aspartyl-tRNA(Asn)/glutamyl-tRNA(Gln) amidotransferase subunit B
LLATIGLEVHAQLLTASKIFCGCSAAFGAAPNTNTCPVCLGAPGALPVLNRKAVEHAARAAIALGCALHPVSVFARKHYFYPDLPKGYQISQYDRPLATGGVVTLADGRRVGIVRVHLEEDAGKSLHEGFAGADRSTGIDFNRSGVPLIEIVTAPDLESGAMAAECFNRIREILVALDVNDGNMEEGSLRCDANISVRRDAAAALGVKAEVKNINSFRYVQRAIEFEIARQMEVVAAGGQVEAETRLWDSASGRTVSMRSKEEAHDYRYFPEPDLPPLLVSEEWTAELRRTLPELPEQMRQRFVSQYALPPYDAGVLTQSAALAAYFEATASACGNPKAASNWIMGEVLGRLNAAGQTIEDLRITPKGLAELIRLVDARRITGPTAKQVFERMFVEGADPAAIVQAEGLGLIDDTEAIAALVSRVLADNAKAVDQFRAGKRQTFGFLVGQAVKASAGKADPEKVADALRRALGTPEM